MIYGAESEPNWVESLATILIVFFVIIVVTAIMIEVETGKPALVALKEWWSR